MLEKTKVLSIILVILLAVSVIGGVIIYNSYQKERQKVASLQDNLEDLRMRYKLTENKLEDTKKQLAQLENKLEEANNQIEMLNNELSKEKQYKEELSNSLQELKENLKAKEEKETGLQQEIERAQKEIKRLQAKLKNTEEEKTELENKIKNLESMQQEKVELGEIVVEQKTPVAGEIKPATKKEEKTKKLFPNRASLEGNVLVVNKDYNFVVINLGKQDGVALNDVFSIYRNEKYLGDVKVEKLHDSMCAAGFVSAGLKEKISEGDRAILKTK